MILLIVSVDGAAGHQRPASPLPASGAAGEPALVGFRPTLCQRIQPTTLVGREPVGQPGSSGRRRAPHHRSSNNRSSNTRRALQVTCWTFGALFQMLGVFAEFERSIITERTIAGIARARKCGTRSGKAIGRPKIDAKIEDMIRASLDSGKGVLKTARELKVGSGTVQRIRRAMARITAAGRRANGETQRDQADLTFGVKAHRLRAGGRGAALITQIIKYIRGC
jgi:hypothetical protein